jgi:hypothetical protein
LKIHESGTIGPTVTVKVLKLMQAGNRIWCENIIACSLLCLYLLLTGAQVPVIGGLSSELVGKSVVVSHNMIIELKSGVIVEVPTGNDTSKFRTITRIVETVSR